MAYLKNSTTRSCFDSEDVVRFVRELLRNSVETLPLTMTIEQGKSGDSFVCIATEWSLDGTETLTSSNERLVISAALSRV